MRKACTVLFLLINVFSASIYSTTGKIDIPDSSQIRKNIIETWFMPPLDILRMKNAEIYSNKIGRKFQIRLEEQDATFSIFVSPQHNLAVDIYTDQNKINTEMQQVYPHDVAGSWVLVRNKQTGNPVYIRYYFTNDSDVFIQLNPAPQKTLADLVIFGCYASRSLALEIPFEQFYSASLSDIMHWTDRILPWWYFELNKGMYQNTISMIGIIRSALPDIVYVEDAIYNENEELVSISDGTPIQYDKDKNKDELLLSSAGFIKWVVDGLIIPIAGGSTKRVPLLKRTVTYKENGLLGTTARYYDLSFSLDWTRNLAGASFSVHSGKTYKYPNSKVDVTIQPFSAELTSNGTVSSTGYIKDAGYSSVSLAGLLYVLAATNPEYFYLAAIRQTDRESPEINLFNQCAAIMPYFDDTGRFRCTVFENGTELKLRNFLNKYDGNFIHLVRIKTSDRFYPLQAK